MTEPVEEAWELVEKGVISEGEFRELAFLNPLRLHAGMNPKFFDGTVCAAAAAQPRARSTFRAGVGSKVALISSVAGLIETICETDMEPSLRSGV